ETLPQIGDEIQIQTLEIEDAPVLDVKVVRVIPQKGFAVEFM
ncbi:MAG: PilZ domain-containing protein, partial [Methylomicrobium sp.]|nr:PilZ domain-containing protein [Methylomicrobium sp.]